MSPGLLPAPSYPLARHFGRRQALFGLGAALLSCQYSGSPSERTTVTSHEGQAKELPLIILVAIDGARWQDIYYGPSKKGAAVASSRSELVPHLIEMERQGLTWGAPGAAKFFASGPNFVSLPGYMEMLSGTSRTSCTENDCRTMKRHTLLDDFGELDPHDPTRAGAFSSWPKIEVAASRKGLGVVSAGREGGAHHEVLLSFRRCREAFLRGQEEVGPKRGTRSDVLTARLARAFLSEARPDFLFASLGESDEHAHQGNYLDYLRAIQFADGFVGKLRNDLKQAEAQGRQTLLLVTTDHGRAQNFNDHGRKHPESARGFLFAEGTLVAPVGRIQGEAAYLRDIAPTVRALTGLTPRKDAGSGRILREIMV